MDYIDLNIRIGPHIEGNRYAVCVRSPVVGEQAGEFVAPVTDEQLELFVLRVGLARRGVRQIHSPEWRAARDFGQKLFSAVFPDRLLSTLIASRNDAIRQSKGLRLTLSLDAPDLANYPWEFLYDRDAGQFLSLFEETPVVRYVELLRPILPLTVTPPLRILAVASSPNNFAPLDLSRERRNLSAALQKQIGAGLIEIDWLTAATLDALREQLLTGTYHIFHFIGHGGFDEAQQDGVLLFETEKAEPRVISGERIAVLLGNHRTLRLAVLNACEGARTSRQDPFAGTALTLMRTGNLPAVVAMQFEITDTAAIDFSRGFYSALAAGRPVDAAVSQGRQAIFAEDNDTEWCTPVLYLRAADAKIFDIDTAAAARLKAERERIGREQEEQARRAAERAEADRLAAERVEQERLAKEKAESERLAALAKEQERLERERLEQERLEKERAAAERLAVEKAEQERLAREKAEQERLAAIRAEEERVAKEKAEQERLAREKEKADLLAAEKAKQERLAREQDEAARAAAEAQERERQLRERISAENAERAKREFERAERERAQVQQSEPEPAQALTFASAAAGGALEAPPLVGSPSLSAAVPGSLRYAIARFTGRFWVSVELAALSWGVAQFVPEPLVRGLIGGAGTAIALGLVAPGWNWKQLLVLAAGWTLAVGASWKLLYGTPNSPGPFWTNSLTVVIVLSTTGGLLSALIVRWWDSSTGWRILAPIVAGCILAWVLGDLVDSGARALFFTSNTFAAGQDLFRFIFIPSLNGLIAGALAGGILFWQVRAASASREQRLRGGPANVPPDVLGLLSRNAWLSAGIIALGWTGAGLLAPGWDFPGLLRAYLQVDIMRIVAGGLIGGAFMAAAARRVRPGLNWTPALALAGAWWLAYLVANLPPRFGPKFGPYYKLWPESVLLWAACGLAGGLVTAFALRTANDSNGRKQIVLSGLAWAAAWFFGILGGTGFAEGDLGRPSPLLPVFTSNFALQGLTAGILGGVLTVILFGRETLAPSREPAETGQTASRPFELALTNPLWAVALTGIGWAVAGAIGAPSMMGRAPDWPIALVIGLLGGTGTVAALRLVARDLDLNRMLLAVAGWGISVSMIAFINTATWLAVPVALFGGGLVTGYALQRRNDSIEWTRIAIVAAAWAVAWITGGLVAFEVSGGESPGIVVWFALSGIIGSALTLMLLRTMVSQTGRSHRGA